MILVIRLYLCKLQALLRPGRLDRKLFVPLPDAETRKAIFTLQFKKTPINETVDVEVLVFKTEGYSGAEVSCAQYLRFIR